MGQGSCEQQEARSAGSGSSTATSTTSGASWSRASDIPHHIHDAHKDSRRPIFHPLAPRGWSSDPCGPLLFRNRYHLFYQHLACSAQWFWGLCWAHSVSDDLVHWRNLPPAVVPTPGGLDADGCFSGTVELDPELGVPVILYTGVFLKSNAAAVAAHGLPPPAHDPGTHFVEKQLAAVPADPDDPDLTYWVKLPSPAIPLPPPGLNISCWRDPYALQRPAAAGGEGKEWVILLASGIRGVGGAVLRFRSRHFTHGWQFDGILTQGNNADLDIRGQDWECPILAALPCTTKRSILEAIVASASGSSVGPLGSSGGGSSSSGAIAAPRPSSTLGSPLSSSCCDASSTAMPGTPRAGSSRALRQAPAAVSLSSLSNFGGSSTSLATVADAHAPAAAAASRRHGSSASLTTVHDAAASLASATHASDLASGGAAALLPPGAPSSAAAGAAAAGSAGAAEDAAELLHHPAVSLDAWLEEQTQQQTQQLCSAGGGGDGVGLAPPGLLQAGEGTALTPLEDDAAPAAGDATAIIAGEDDAASDEEAAAAPAKPSLHVSFAPPSTPAPHGCALTAADALVRADADAAAATATASGCQPGSGQPGTLWWFCMSPDACSNPCLWWLGQYDGRSFDIAAADGPHQLDLGTTLYAATLYSDPAGRQLLYGWIQEHRRVATPPALVADFSYAGAISTPRVLQLVDGRLYQTPLPEINALRTRVSWHQRDLLLLPGGPLLPLRVVSGAHLDINLTLLPPPADGAGGTACSAATATAAASAAASGAEQAAGPRRAGLVFKSWKEGGKGAAVLSFDWDSGALTVVFDEPLPDAYTPHPEDTPERRRVGGRLRNYVAGEPLSLRVLLDGSAVEVFTSSGETLSTRVYRGHPPSCACTSCSPASGGGGCQLLQAGPAAGGVAACASAASLERAGRCEHSGDSGAAAAVQEEEVQELEEEDDETGIALLAAGTPVLVSRLDVWEMGSCWVPASPAPPQPPALLQQRQHLAACQQAAADSSSISSSSGSSGSSDNSGGSGNCGSNNSCSASLAASAAATAAAAEAFATSAGNSCAPGAGTLHDAALAAAEAALAAADLGHSSSYSSGSGGSGSSSHSSMLPGMAVSSPAETPAESLPAGPRASGATAAGEGAPWPDTAAAEAAPKATLEAAPQHGIQGHHAAGEQAVVAEAFLHDLNIHTL